MALAEQVEKRTLQQQVLMNLRSRLAQGEIAPGLRIVEAVESERLGVSRGTVREALRQLEQEGIIVRSPRRDVHVRELTSQEIVDLYAVRGALESLALRAVCRLGDKAFERTVQELRRQLVALESASRTSEEEVASDLGFHEVLCESSNNGILLVHWRQLAALLRNLLMSGRASIVLALPEHHRRLFAQIEARDADVAINTLMEGFNRSRNDLVYRRQTLNRQDEKADGFTRKRRLSRVSSESVQGRSST